MVDRGDGWGRVVEAVPVAAGHTVDVYYRAPALPGRPGSLGPVPQSTGGLVALLANEEQRGALAAVQSLMSLLEGHGNRVMNTLGRTHVSGQARMARVLQARRQSKGAVAAFHKLVGLESKMRQYEVGEAFVEAVEREAGPHAIDAAWRGPEWLPSSTELHDPTSTGSANNSTITQLF